MCCEKNGKNCKDQRTTTGPTCVRERKKFLCRNVGEQKRRRKRTKKREQDKKKSFLPPFSSKNNTWSRENCMLLSSHTYTIIFQISIKLPGKWVAQTSRRKKRFFFVALCFPRNIFREKQAAVICKYRSTFCFRRLPLVIVFHGWTRRPLPFRSRRQQRTGFPPRPHDKLHRSHQKFPRQTWWEWRHSCSNSSYPPQPLQINHSDDDDHPSDMASRDGSNIYSANTHTQRIIGCSQRGIHKICSAVTSSSSCHFNA